MNNTPVTTKSLLQYGIIAVPIAFAGFPLYVLAPDFYATHHGLSLTLLGTLLLSIRLFDAVQDPVIGWLTDRLRGKILPLIACASILLCLSVFGLFNETFFSPAIWFALCMFFAVTSYSILTIAVGAQATLWTADKDDQTRIAGMREAFGLIGLVIAVSMPAILAHIVSPNRVFLCYAAILTILMMAGVAGFSRVLRGLSSVEKAQKKAPVSLLSGLRALSPDSLRLFAIYAVSMLASSIPAVLVIFYVRDLLKAENLTGVFLLLYFLSGAAGMPVWKKLSMRLGKYKTWCLSNFLAVAGFVAAFFLGAGDIWLYAAVCIASGIALGADLTLPPSILADDIHARGNERFSGTHYAGLAFIAKAALALASAIAFPVLDAAGFKPQTANPENALLALSMAYALIPCALKLVAAGLIYFFFTRSHSGGNDETIENTGSTRGNYYA
jgi:Na+/melibiose symporter-like transporter